MKKRKRERWRSEKKKFLLLLSHTKGGSPAPPATLTYCEWREARGARGARGASGAVRNVKRSREQLSGEAEDGGG